MITLTVDTHTHTIQSGHAFGTVEENFRRGAERGLEAIAVTDHFGLDLFKTGAPSLEFGYVFNFGALPKLLHGVEVLAGTEIDIIDFAGNLAGHKTPCVFAADKTMGQFMLETRDIAIASVHYFHGCMGGSVAENTRMYCRVMENPYIDIIGHIGRSGLRLELDTVLKTARDTGTFIEINESTYGRGAQVWERCRNIARRCAELGVAITVGSDAHSAHFVGEFTHTVSMLEKMGFPQELIANTSLQRLRAMQKKR